jgi:hypothetical protein
MYLIDKFIIATAARSGQDMVPGMTREDIPRYTFNTAGVTKSPVNGTEFDLFKKTVLFSGEDLGYLRPVGTVLEDQIEAVLDVWYSFGGSLPHLAHDFTAPKGQFDSVYLAAVQVRFGQWIRETCKACYDQAWLDYQQEIALRHTPAQQNQTDKVAAAADHVPLRYMISFSCPITATIKPFLSKEGLSAGETDKMYQAWFEAVVLQVSLGSELYAKVGFF